MGLVTPPLTHGCVLAILFSIYFKIYYHLANICEVCIQEVYMSCLPSYTRLCVVLCLCAIVFIFGCSSEDDPIGPEDQVSAESTLVLANQSLSTVINVAINQTLKNLDSTFRPRDIDFTEAYALYKSALAKDPSNTDAQFGVAFTDLLIFLADDELNDLYDRFKTLVDTLPLRPVYLAPRFSLGGDIRPGIPLTSSSFLKMMTDPSKLEGHILLAAAADPNISDIQNVLKSKLMPMIEEAITLLDQVIVTEGYEFIISAEMQGNPGADGIELDRPDFRIFKATLLTAKAGLHIFLARDLDIESYDVAGAEIALQQSSSFAGLHLDGAAHMASSKAALLDGADEVQLALDDLIAEITGDPDQANDLIPVYPEDEADLNDIKIDLTEYQDYFNGVRTLEIVINSQWIYQWNGSYYEYVVVEDTFSTAVDVSRFFDNPIINPKQLLPNYTLSLEEINDLHLSLIIEHFDRTRYWDALVQVYGTSDSLKIVDSVIKYMGAYYDLPHDGTQAFYDAIADYGTGQQFVLGWDDAYLGCGPTQAKSLWCYNSSQWRKYQYLWQHPDQIASCFFWEATTYQAWTAPNPTFNELFPDMTSLDWKEEFWEFPEDWTQGDCDTFFIGD